MQCSERVVALPDPKNVEKHQPNQHLRRKVFGKLEAGKFEFLATHQLLITG
jgi:hypothetical protein